MNSQPPVRRRVPIHLPSRGAAAAVFAKHFPQMQLYVLGSGTESLAVAIADASARKPVTSPEVILPAYGCPDLVAACIHAGVHPRLVDVEHDAWGYRLQELEQAITPRTVAIVAVNLLGTGDQSATLSALARSRGIFLIQDSAQYLPDQVASSWPGEYVVLSFGRGKPLNLLQGGALLAGADRQLAISACTHQLGFTGRSKAALLSSVFAAVTFNTITHPAAYGWVAKLPGLGLGQTRYSELQGCFAMPASFNARVHSAFADYTLQSNYRIDLWMAALERWQRRGIQQLKCVEGRAVDDLQRLRLPLLAPDRQTRDAIVDGLSMSRLGATSMYQLPLNQIAGVPEVVRGQGPFVSASALADRLFTLPTHASVNVRAVQEAEKILA